MARSVFKCCQSGEFTPPLPVMEAVKTVGTIGTRSALWYNIKDIILKGAQEIAEGKRMEDVY